MNTSRIVAAFFIINSAVLVAGQQPAPKPVPTVAWAPKPIKTPAYKAGLKPWVKLADIKARHKGADWNEVIADDGRLVAAYHSSPPGGKLTKRFHPDTREWFAIVEGEVRVEIEGQEPFTATRGSLVNIPRQTIYSLETLGTTPSLRFSLNVSGAKTVFVKDAAAPPPPAAGTTWAEVRINRTPGRYDEFNQPHTNIHAEAAKNEKYSGGRFVRDDKSEMLILYGHEKNMPPLDPNDKGHFHAESAEMWLVFSGKIRYSFEGQQPFIASEGDVVYVPSNTWHATRYIGDNACRLSITEYVGNALLLPPQ
jgi:quercetin dioxygenase-like cupin family protein